MKNEFDISCDFKDAEFMTGEEKVKVLKDWIMFLLNDFENKYFTKRLYEHLHLHCGFIAHYDIHGFYETYFKRPVDTEAFFKRMFMYEGRTNLKEYEDLHAKMYEVYSLKQNEIKGMIEKGIDDRLDLLEECIKRARTDKDFARKFLKGLE